MENVAQILLTLIIIVMSFMISNLYERVKKLEEN